MFPPGIYAHPPSGFNLVAQPWTGLWLAEAGGEYNGAPWAGKPSAGTSGASNLIAGVEPAVGAALNGHPPADFNGSSHYLVGDPLSSYFGATWYVAILARADTRNAPIGPAHDPPLVCDASGGFAVSVSTSGARARQVDSVGNNDTGFVTFAGTTWTLVEAWNDGANLNVSSGGGTAQTVACGAITNPGVRTLQLGISAFGNYFDGQLAALGIMAAVPSAGTRSSIKADLSSRYGLSL